MRSLGLGIGLGIDIYQPWLLQGGGPPVYDPDAEAFFVATGIVDNAEKSAVNTLVIAFKDAALWTLMHAIYPFVGGTAGRHAVNLKTPGTFDITWNGTVVHDSNGITGDGATGYGDTGLNLVSDTTPDSLAFGVYSRTDIAEVSRDIATQTPSVDVTGIWTKYIDGNTYFDNNQSIGRCVAASPTSLGLWTSSRTASNLHRGFNNDTQVAVTTAGQGTLDNSTFAILRASGATFSTRNLAFAFISDGLTAIDMINFNAAVQAYQTSLSRQV